MLHWLRVPAALAVYVATIAAAFTGKWPWPRLHVAAPITVSSAWIDVADTLRPGETLGQLFERQGMASFDIAHMHRIGQRASFAVPKIPKTGHGRVADGDRG